MALCVKMFKNINIYYRKNNLLWHFTLKIKLKLWTNNVFKYLVEFKTRYISTTYTNSDTCSQLWHHNERSRLQATRQSRPEKTLPRVLSDIQVFQIKNQNATVKYSRSTSMFFFVFLCEKCRCLFIVFSLFINGNVATFTVVL